MKDILVTLLYAFVLMASIIYSWYKLSDKKINFKNYKLYITLIGMMLTSIINFFTINKFIRVTLITVIFIIFFKFLFKEKLNKTIITPIFSQLIIFISEFLYALILLLIFGNESNETINAISNNTLITNIVIATMLLLALKLKFIKKLYNKLLETTNRISSVQLSLLCIIGIIILNILLASAYYKIKIQYFLIFNVIMIIMTLAIIFYSFKTQNKYNKVSDKYNVAIKSLNDYENMMTKYRIANHENKNLLLTVRAMIINKDKDIPKYIDSIIEDKYMDDEKLLFKVSSIPSGGLRATIYSEILKIKENKIDYILNIDRKLRAVDLLEFDTDTVIDICKIIGVFIDNAIEAVKGLRRKNIDIDLYVEDNMVCIKVSNNYKGNIEITKINNEGYTTKGEGHGYGLSLVKKIIDNNSIFEHKTEISKNIFSQILIIKYKNHIK